MDCGPVDSVLGRLVDPAADPTALRADPSQGRTRAHAVDALTAFWAGDHEACGRHARAARAVAATPDDQALAWAAAGLASSGATPATRVDWAAAAALLDRAPAAPGPALAPYLLAEAALACARLDVASALITDLGWVQTWAGHRFEAVVLATVVRIRAFTGRIDLAAEGLAALEVAAGRSGTVALAEAVAVLVHGNADHPEETQARIDAVVASRTPTGTHLGRGVHLLAAYGALSLGDVGQAASLVLLATAEGGFDRLPLVDRALAWEVLTHAALLVGDLEAAHAWAVASAPLRHHPIARPPCERLLARIALAEDDPVRAMRHAATAVDAARAEGREIEAAEGTILLARARIADDRVAEATRSLREAVQESDARGYHAVRRSAGQVLASARRRLPPPSAGGWEVLSVRERQVAEHVLEGHDVTAVARRMGVSPSTVRVHLSRVLCAFGVSSRLGRVLALGPRGEADWEPPVSLTRRQQEVTALVARGHDNTEVAHLLGISVKAVEKHVGDALRRWEAPSRFHLARCWMLHQGLPPTG